MTESLQVFDKSDLDRMYPYVVPRTWVDYATKEALVAWAFSEEVVLILVLDCDGSVQNVRPEDLQAVRISDEEAFDIATRNLGNAWHRGQFGFGFATLQDNIVIGGARGNWMAPAGALILGNFYHELKNHFKCEQFAAVAVNQECLFAFPVDETTCKSKSLRLAIDDEFTNHRKPISKSWLLLDGSWPQEYPGGAQF